jgi:hypothetical protein
MQLFYFSYSLLYINNITNNILAHVNTWFGIELVNFLLLPPGCGQKQSKNLLNNKPCQSIEINSRERP